MLHVATGFDPRYSLQHVHVCVILETFPIYVSIPSIDIHSILKQTKSPCQDNHVQHCSSLAPSPIDSCQSHHPTLNPLVWWRLSQEDGPGCHVMPCHPTDEQFKMVMVQVSHTVEPVAHRGPKKLEAPQSQCLAAGIHGLFRGIPSWIMIISDRLAPKTPGKRVVNGCKLAKWSDKIW